MKQNMEQYSAQDQLVWTTMFKRQYDNIQTKGSKQYLECLNSMNLVLNERQIPDFSKINQWFESSTNWKIEVVPGLIPVDDFFSLLAEKRFCSSTWLRTMEQLDYLEEPDMFHDIFGHIPLLSNPIFSQFAHDFGKLGKSLKGNPMALKKLQRLYWYTIEFGLIEEQGQLKSYGAGILSSFGETNRVAKRNCTIHPFNITEIANKHFETDHLQEEYFLIKSLNNLKDGLDILSIELSRKIEF